MGARSRDGIVTVKVCAPNVKCSSISGVVSRMSEKRTLVPSMFCKVEGEVRPCQSLANLIDESNSNWLIATEVRTQAGTIAVKDFCREKLAWLGRVDLKSA